MDTERIFTHPQPRPYRASYLFKPILLETHCYSKSLEMTDYFGDGIDLAECGGIKPLQTTDTESTLAGTPNSLPPLDHDGESSLLVEKHSPFMSNDKTNTPH